MENSGRLPAISQALFLSNFSAQPNVNRSKLPKKFFTRQGTKARQSFFQILIRWECHPTLFFLMPIMGRICPSNFSHREPSQWLWVFEKDGKIARWPEKEISGINMG
jgi:hypothetical protein